MEREADVFGADCGDDELVARRLQKEEEDLQLSLRLARENEAGPILIIDDADDDKQHQDFGDFGDAATAGDLQVFDLLMAEHLQAEELSALAAADVQRGGGKEKQKEGGPLLESMLRLEEADMHSLFLHFNERYFWGQLSCVEVKWSKRMTLCAGICKYEGRGGLCSIGMSEPLLKFRPRSDMIDTLLHEMIHAYLFVTASNKDHDDHGQCFLEHMYRINKAAGTNISVYHSFHNEVAHYRQHWWKCEKCHNVVKRAMNRPPSPRDPWFPGHQAKCGGAYVKIKEPEGYQQPKKRKPKSESGERLGGKKRHKTEPADDDDGGGEEEKKRRHLHGPPAAQQQRSMLDFIRMPAQAVKKEEKENEPPLTVIELDESPPTSPPRPPSTTATGATWPKRTMTTDAPRRSSSPPYLLLELDDVGT